MKLKFNRMERLAGVFLLVALLGTGLTTLGVLLKRGLFEARSVYFTTLDSASNIRIGTPVQMAGLRAGAVEQVTLSETKGVIVKFSIVQKYTSLVRRDSRIRVLRPSIIGEKIFDLTVGSSSSGLLAAGESVSSDGKDDIVDLLSGAKLFQVVANLEKITGEAVDIVQQANHERNFQKMVENLRMASEILRKSIPAFVAKGPQFSEDAASTMKNFALLTKELAQLAPAITQSAESLPSGSKKLIELLSETLTLVRGMQRSFLFSGGVNAAKEEEADKQRQPAAQGAATPAPAPATK